MWSPVGVLLGIVGVISASVFLENPSTSEPDVKSHGSSFGSNFDRRQDPNLFLDSDWSNWEPNSASLAEWNDQSTDTFFGGTDSDLPTPDNWQIQLEASAPTGDCNDPMSSMRRLKRFDQTCTTESEDEQPICETAFFSIPLCCLGPRFGELVIVNRCQRYDLSLYSCRDPKYVYCCREYEADIFAGLVCIKAFPESEDDEDIPIPPTLNNPYPGGGPDLDPPFPDHNRRDFPGNFR